MSWPDYLAAVGGTALTAAQVRHHWRAWAQDHARDDIEPDDDYFASVAERFARAEQARDSDSPLSSWRFAGTVRPSQQAMLDAIDVGAGESLHLVAPPGAGKTLIGLLLAARHGKRTLVLSPTTTIAHQWFRQAQELAPDASTVSNEPATLGDLTSLTYQRVSVPDRSDAFAPLAHAAWLDELADGDHPDAAQWLDHLARANPKAYQQGIARRSRALRRQLSRQSPERLAAALHPNARVLIDDIVRHGVETIIVDECHHLLDHWALIVAYLRARITSAGTDALLIGLTATVPSEHDAAGFDNYSALLGPVDFEQPTPAVVREGNLAPYRDVVWFTEPTAQERAFLHRKDALLTGVIARTLGSAEGIAFLHAQLSGDGADEDQRIAAAFDRDFTAAHASTVMLRQVAPADPLLERLPETRPDIGDAELRMLARYLLDHVLPDPARADDWQAARRALADFGYSLTDRGIRRGRDPIDALMAVSAAKDEATAEILAYEADVLGDRLRAVVVSDQARQGARAGVGATRAGAIRTFEEIVDDARLVALMPVMLTAQHLRIATRDVGTILPRLAAKLGVLPLVESTHGNTVELQVPGVSRPAVLAAVSALVADGFVRVLVGTRGLLGEGWDCPAVNTLIDLTTASTSAASQQLRGRTMRLDPAWPEKVAHNWTVVAVMPHARAANARSDVRRLHRKLDAQWGVRVEGAPDIVRGAEHTLTVAQRDALERGTASGRELTTLTLGALPARAATRDRWHADGQTMGSLCRRAVARTAQSPRALLVPPALERFLGASSAGIAVLGSGAATAGVLAAGADPTVGAFALVAAGLGALGFAASGWTTRSRRTRLRTDALAGTAGVASAVLVGLQEAQAVGPDAVVVVTEDRGTPAVEIRGATDAEQAVFRAAYVELTSPVRTPRFLLELDRGAGNGLMERLATKFLALTDREGTLLPVPARIGRRREGAQAFADAWRERVGPAQLHELDGPEDMHLIVSARRASERRERTAFARDVWA